MTPTTNPASKAPHFSGLALGAGKAARAAFTAEKRALRERIDSAPVTITSDGRHVGWHNPRGCNIYRTRELAQEFGCAEPQIVCTHFARADSIICVPMTLREYRASFAQRVAA